MIFKQLKEIISGQKTQTRRLVKQNEMLASCEGGLAVVTYKDALEHMRIKWQVGRDYAVKNSMYAPGMYVSPDWSEAVSPQTWNSGIDDNAGEWRKWSVRTDYAWQEKGYKPLRVRITGIRQELLQDISEQDAIAEGIARYPNTDPSSFEETPYMYGTSVMDGRYYPAAFAYAALWNFINPSPKRIRFESNPLVWVISFEVVK